ncbi:MAG: lipid II flippase MurJ [Pyrinomonadaceae bacterium]
MKQTLTLAVLAGANILLSLLFQWYVITQLGVGIETDALFAAMALPTLILSVVSSSLTHVLVPLLATENEITFRQNAWGFFLGVSALFTILALALFVTAGYWVPWLVPGFSVPAKLLTVSLTKIQLVSMILTASVSVLWSVYHARKQFIWVELSTLLSNLVALGLIIKLLAIYGIAAAAFIIVLRTLMQVLWLLPGLGRWQWPRWDSEAMREARRRIRPLLIGTAYYRTDPLVDRYLASMAPAGGLSLLYIGQQIYGVANVIAEKAIAAPMVPQLAIEAAAGRWSTFKRIYQRRLLMIGGLAAAGYVILLLAGERILNLLIGHGGVTADNVHLLWLIMVALVGFFIGGAMGQITSTTFYAMGDTSTPTRMSIITFTLYVPAKVIAFMQYGLMGLAVVTSIYLFVNLIIQILLLEGWVIPRRQKGL